MFGLEENPVFRRELRDASGLRIAVQSLCVLAAAGSVIEAVGFASRTLDHPFAGYLVYALNLLLPPALIIPTIAAERDQGTGQELALTPFPRQRLLRGLIWGRTWPLAAQWAVYVLTDLVRRASGHPLLPAALDPVLISPASATGAGLLLSITTALDAVWAYRSPTVALAVAYIMVFLLPMFYLGGHFCFLCIGTEYDPTGLSMVVLEVGAGIWLLNYRSREFEKRFDARIGGVE